MSWGSGGYVKVSELIVWPHHFGTNILGLLLLFIQIGMFFLVIPCLEAGWRVLGGCFLFLSLLLPSGCDICWRSLAQPRGSLWRFVMPGSGGALLCIPVWLLIMAQPIVGLVLLIQNALGWR